MNYPSLRSGETILWPHGTVWPPPPPERPAPGSGEARKHLALRLFNIAFGLAQAGYALWQIWQRIRSGESDATVLIWVAVLFAGGVIAGHGFRAASRRVRPTVRRGFVFQQCLITSQRVLLHDGGLGTAVSLDREDVGEVALDYAQGARSVEFRSRDGALSYAVIGDPVPGVLHAWRAVNGA